MFREILIPFRTLIWICVMKRRASARIQRPQRFVDGYLRLHEADPLLNASEGTPQAVLARELVRRASTGNGGEFYITAAANAGAGILSGFNEISEQNIDAQFHPLCWERLSKSGERSVVSCAAPYLERPAGTIGLGDTFLAGTLLVLGGAEGAKTNVRTETSL